MTVIKEKKSELNIYLVDKCRIIQFIILEGRIKGRNIGFVGIQ